METRALATDAIVLLGGEILLLERTQEPYQGSWVLPGGCVERDEARRVDTFDPANLPALGFDHRTIISDATTMS